MKIILGGGIAGLIWAYYNKEYSILSPEFGGQFNQHFQIGPRYLDDTKDTRKFLKELRIKTKPIKIKVGYYTTDWISANNQFKRDYWIKSRGISDREVSYIKYFLDKTALNSNRSEFMALEVNFNDIITKLINKIGKSRLIQDKAKKIKTSSKTIVCRHGKEYKYKELVCAIPKNIFLDLCKIKGYNLQSISMTYVKLAKEYFDTSEFDFVYLLSPGKIEHRITNCGDCLVADVAGFVPENILKAIYQDFYLDSKIIPNAQIISGNVVFKAEGVSFIGRYGTWDRSWKTEKVITEAMRCENGRINTHVGKTKRVQ